MFIDIDIFPGICLFVVFRCGPSLMSAGKSLSSSLVNVLASLTVAAGSLTFSRACLRSV